MAGPIQAETDPATAGFVAEWVAKLCLGDVGTDDDQCGESCDDTAHESPLQDRTNVALDLKESAISSSSSSSRKIHRRSCSMAANLHLSESHSFHAAAETPSATAAATAAAAVVVSADIASPACQLTPRRLRVAVQPRGSPAAVPLFLPNDFGGDAVWGQTPGLGGAARSAAFNALSPPRRLGPWTDGASNSKTRRRTAFGVDNNDVAGVRRALGWEDNEVTGVQGEECSSRILEALGGEPCDSETFASPTRCDLFATLDDNVPQSPPRFSPPDAGSPRSCTSGSVSPMSVLPAPLLLSMSASVGEMGEEGRSDDDDEDALLMLPNAWGEAVAEGEVLARRADPARAQQLRELRAPAAARTLHQTRHSPIGPSYPRSTFSSPPPRAPFSPPVPHHEPLPPAWNHASAHSPPGRCSSRARTSPVQYSANHSQNPQYGESHAHSRSGAPSPWVRHNGAHGNPRSFPSRGPPTPPQAHHQPPAQFRAWPAPGSALPPIGACGRNNFCHPAPVGAAMPMSASAHMGVPMGMLGMPMPLPNQHPSMAMRRPMHMPMHMPMPMPMPMALSMGMPMPMNPLALSSVPVHLPPHLAFPCRPFPGSGLAGKPANGSAPQQGGGKAEKAAGRAGDAGGAAAAAAEGSSGTGVFLPRPSASSAVESGGAVAGVEEVRRGESVRV